MSKFVFVILLMASFASAQDVTPTPTPAPAPEAAVQAPAPSVAKTGKIEGVLLEKGTKKPLADVNIFALPAKLKGTSDSKGKFTITDVPEGDVELVINQVGYQRLSRKGEFRADDKKPLRLFLEKMDYQGFEITVRDRAKKRDDTTRSMGADQFLTVPGANGDPVKAVQNLPGVARVAGFSSQIIIQGSAPQDTTYMMDDHEVPLVFHFGGLTSVITPEAIDQVDYLSAGYGPEYGRALGGLIGLRTRNPATDRQHGFVFADTMKSGILLEGPIDDKSAYLVTGRYSYIGFVLKQVIKDNPRFALTVAPSFGDLSFIYTRKLSDKDDFKLSSIGSHDELQFLLKEPAGVDPTIRGNFSNETNFYRLIPQWTHKFDDGATGRQSLGMGQDMLTVDVGDNYFKLKNTMVTSRTEYEMKPNSSWTTQLGLDAQFTKADVALRLPNTNGTGGVSDPFSSGELVEVDDTQTDYRLGPYWRNTFKGEGAKFSYMPSLRVDYFDVTKEVKPQPRLAIRYDENNWLNYRAAAGLYYQPPQPQETAPQYGNPDVKSPYAYHFTVGGEKDFREGNPRGFVVQTNLFYRLFENLVVSSSRVIDRGGVQAFEKYANDGKGRSYGAEFLIKYEAKPWSGWLSYTVSSAYREEPTTGEHIFAYDQTHNVNLVGSYDFENNWKVSGRARYVTGNPYTPVASGIFDADHDTYIPVRGPIYSERIDPFIQLDVRVDKKWIYDSWILWGYLDVQNITNAQNPEAIRYSYDYSQKTQVTGLPTIPTIGVRGEF
jgi:hypothetical protein